MSDKSVIRKEIREWCKTGFRSWSARCAVNQDGENIDVALFPGKKLDPEIDTEPINNIISELQRRFRSETIVVKIYEGRSVQKKRPKRA